MTAMQWYYFTPFCSGIIAGIIMPGFWNGMLFCVFAGIANAITYIIQVFFIGKKAKKMGLEYPNMLLSEYPPCFFISIIQTILWGLIPCAIGVWIRH